MRKTAAVSSRSIRHRLFIAACLMSVIPILVFLNYVFPSVFVSFVSRPNLSLIILVITVIAALGFVVIKQIVDPVIRLSKDAKLIAEGDAKRRIEIKSDDEIGQLGAALNQLRGKIDILIRQIEKLEIKDMLTGLHNEQYIRNRLDEEIKRAVMYQRPCGFILAKLNNFSAYQNKYGQIVCETALKKVASCLSSALTDVERIARFADYEFAIVLPEKNKRSCEKIAGELKDKVECLFKDEPELDKRLSITAAVAENPLDGISAQELIAFAQNALG